MSSIFLSLELHGTDEIRRRLAELGAGAADALRLAVNHGADQARVLGNREIRNQVRLTEDYINQRLTVTRFATNAIPEAVISGRRDATSLFRYSAKMLTVPAKNGRTRNAGVSTYVKSLKVFKHGFIVHNLKTSGGSAVVLREKPLSRLGRWDGLRVLYGPSVDQLWRGVREDITPSVIERIQLELLRRIEGAGG